MIREWYTHIGGQPTRLQASTRYINYEHGFDYVTPASIAERSAAKAVYDELMAEIQKHLARLDELGVPREDSATGLPPGMQRDRLQHNLRNLMDMSRQRMVAAVHITNTARTVQRPMVRELERYRRSGTTCQPLLHAKVQWFHRFLPGL